MTGPAPMTGLRATVAAAAVALCLLTSAGSDGQSMTNETQSTPREMAFETLTVRVEGGVLFAAIAAPPMNLLGPALVRDLVCPHQARRSRRRLQGARVHERRP